MSCATCHKPDRAWTDGQPRARGNRGQELGRNTPSLLIARYGPLFFWDGRAADIEQAALVAAQNPEEMNQDLPGLTAKLRAIPGYQAQFQKVYGRDASAEDAGKALAAFVVSIPAAEDSHFDEFLRAGKGLTPAELRGWLVFSGPGNCRTCHFSNRHFHDIGLASKDLGRYLIEPRPDNWRAFKVPSLRNVARTAPYMHDGSLATLEDVVDFYDRGGDEKRYEDANIRPLHLTPGQKSDLLAFLNSMTSTIGTVTPPELPPGEAPRSPAPAPPPAPRTLESEASALESEAKTAASALEGSLAALARARLFEPKPVEGWVDAARARAYCAASPWTVEQFKSEARLYYMCRALVTDDTSVCYEMGHNSRASIFYKHSDCVRGYWNLKLARAVISRGPELDEVCRDHVDFEAQFGPVDRAAVCRELRADDPGPLCRLLQSGYPDAFRHPDLADCVSEDAVFWGRGRDCEAFGMTGYQFMEEQLCAATSRYRKAREGRDPALCGDAVLCRALEGDAAACDRYLAGLRAKWCRVSGPADEPSNPDARAAALAGQIEGALAATAGRPMSPREKAAAARLDLVMTREKPLEPFAAVSDVVLLRAGALGDLVSRGRALCAARPAAAGCGERSARLAALRARADRAIAGFSSKALPLDPRDYAELFVQ